MTEMRIQQILARAGVASRRRAEGLMTAGRVSVNGKPVTTLGARADPAKDVIAVDGKAVGPAQAPTTLMLHKPVGVMTTLDDPEGRETVADLVKDELMRLVPVGRLDYHTEGLLLMTTDGELMNRLLHPRHHVPKVYQVKVRGRVVRAAMDNLREGVDLEDGRTRPTVVESISEGDGHTWLELVVTEGRNRLVRRMVEAVGHPAQRVVRTEMATLELGTLKPGQYRYLDAAELAAIYTTAGLTVPKLSERAEEVHEQVLGSARRGRGALPNQPGGSSRLPSPDGQRSQGLRSEGSRSRLSGSSRPESRRGREEGSGGPRGRTESRGRSPSDRDGAVGERSPRMDGAAGGRSPRMDGAAGGRSPRMDGAAGGRSPRRSLSSSGAEPRGPRRSSRSPTGRGPRRSFPRGKG